MSSVMSEFDPEDSVLSKTGRKPAPSRTSGMKRIVGMNPSTGQLTVEGGSDAPLFLFIDMGGTAHIGPAHDQGIDQDQAHADRRPRSFADAQGIDQLGG